MAIKNKGTKYTVENQKRVLCTSIKGLRNDNNLTQKSVADHAELTTQTIINVESNKANPSLFGLLKMLEPLGKTLIIADISQK